MNTKLFIRKSLNMLIILVPFFNMTTTNKLSESFQLEKITNFREFLIPFCWLTRVISSEPMSQCMSYQKYRKSRINYSLSECLEEQTGLRATSTIQVNGHKLLENFKIGDIMYITRI